MPDLEPLMELIFAVRFRSFGWPGGAVQLSFQHIISTESGP